MIRRSSMRSSLLLGALTTLSTALGSCSADGAHDWYAGGDALRTEELPAPRIDRASMSGSGCPDSDRLFISGTRDTFFARFDDFLATVSPQAQKAESECTISLTLDGPDGVAYAPAGLDAELTTDSNSQVTISTRGTWPIVSSPALVTSSIFRESLFNTQGRPATKKIFDESSLLSPCFGPRALTVTTKLRVEGQAGRSGYAAIRALSNLRFYAQSCADRGGDRGMDAGVDGGTDRSNHESVERDSGIARGDAATERLRIDRVQALGGAGCPTETLTVTLPEDRSTFSVDFGPFTARNADSPFCAFILSLTPPPGYRADIASYVLAGQTRLTAGSQVTLFNHYSYIDEVPSRPSRSIEYQGPRQGNYRADVVFPQNTATIPCAPRSLVLELGALVASDGADPEPPLELHRLDNVEFRLRPCR